MNIIKNINYSKKALQALLSMGSPIKPHRKNKDGEKQLGLKSLHHFAMLLLCVFNLTHGEYHYIRFLKDVTLSDIALVGGKNASLGQMISALSSQGIRVPHGFAITVDGYNRYISYNNLAP